jgi:tetratricopeptide (TPR) repeat protein
VSEQLESGVPSSNALASESEDLVNAAKTSKGRATRCGLAARADRESLTRGTRTAVFVLSLALSPVLAGTAQAQQLDSVSREAASALAVAGLEAYEAGSYEEALDKLEKSYAVARVPTLGLWSARALYQLGRWREAENRYREAVGLSLPDGDRETQQKALVDAQAELAALTPAIPVLVIQVDGARLDQIELRVDGQPVSSSEPVQRLDPGAHHVEGVRGEARQALDLQLVANDTRTVLLRFEPQSAPVAAHDPGHGSWLRPAGWTAVALGGAGVVVGTVGLILAIQKKDEIDHDDACRNNSCAPGKQDLVDSYDSLRTLSTVGYVAGGVLGALGVGALVVGGQEPGDARAEAVFSPVFTGLRGSF